MKVGDLVKMPTGTHYWWSGQLGIIDYYGVDNPHDSTNSTFWSLSVKVGDLVKYDPSWSRAKPSYHLVMECQPDNSLVRLSGLSKSSVVRKDSCEVISESR